MLNLIPKPAEVKEERGFFKLEKGAAVYSQIDLPLVKNIGGENSPIKIYADASLDKEEYRLSVGEAGIVIKASDKAGAYYALQSVRMLGRLDEGKILFLLLKSAISRNINGAVKCLM